MTRAIAAALAGWAVGVAATLAVLAVQPDEPTQPACPTEDSCTVDYRNGAWHIKEDTP